MDNLMTKSWLDLVELWDEAKAERDKLRGANAELIEALEFYAHPGTYFAVAFMADPPCGDFMDDWDEVDTDWAGVIEKPGKRARAALAKHAPTDGSN